MLMNMKRCIISLLVLVSSSSAFARKLEPVIQALAPYLGEASRPYYEIHGSRVDGETLTVDLGWVRNDGGRYDAVLTLERGELKGLTARTVMPAVDPSAVLAIQPFLQSLTPGPLTVTGLVQDQEGRCLVAYEKTAEGDDGPQRFLAEVTGSGAERKARTYRPRLQDKKWLQRLALMMARFQAFALARRYDDMTAAARERGEEFPGPLGPVARMEAELRLARATTARLQTQTPEESAVGFDPDREWVQYMLPAVLSDNAIFVTFAKDGAYRLEDFN